jgi:hypothetical protein
MEAKQIDKLIGHGLEGGVVVFSRMLAPLPLAFTFPSPLLLYFCGTAV